MGYDVALTDAPETALMVIRERVNPRDLSVRVPALCGEIWDWVKAHGGHGGRMVAVYRHPPGATAFDLEVGVEVPSAVAGDARVAASALPAGPLAVAVHLGDYTKLGEAHQAVLDWLAANGYRRPDLTWEAYGHIRGDGPPRTDVLAPAVRA